MRSRRSSTAGSEVKAAAMAPRPRASPADKRQPRARAHCSVRWITTLPTPGCPAAMERASSVCAATARLSASSDEASQTCAGE